MKNSIAERIVDFIKDFPPFDAINKDSLLDIAREVQITYLENEQVLFQKDDELHSHFYIVRNGAIRLDRIENDKIKIVDICDGGDIFGLRPLIIKENYILTATANEESIIYGIPITIFQQVTENNKKVNNYLISSFASNSFDPYTRDESGEIFENYISENKPENLNIQIASYTKKSITCTASTTIKEAAITMKEKKIGCIVIVNDEKLPLGIVTSSDFKNKVATGLFPIDSTVSEIMSKPVLTFPKKISLAEAQIQMIKNDVSHLCITNDGTPNTKLRGILTQHDIVVSIGNNPAAILKEIKRAKRIKTLRTARLKTNNLLKGYLEQNLPLSHILRIVSEINDAVASQIIKISLRKMDSPPPVSFTWMALGSQGRKEQLLFTDQDNAIIFNNVDKDLYDTTKSYFLKLAKLVTKSLHKIGYDYCPAEMMASNPQWCLSIDEWKLQFNHWIQKPDEKAIFLSSIFFDFNYVYGEKSLTEELSNCIFKSTEASPNFFMYLGKEAIETPSPLSFFKQFIVEQNGEHKDFFNIKIKALMPLINAARLLILSKNILGINNTAHRFEKLAQIEPQNKELFESCAYAFKALLKFRTKQGLINGNSGKFIDLTSLSKEEKMKLKRCFKPIREIQELLIIRFQLGNIL